MPKRQREDDGLDGLTESFNKLTNLNLRRNPPRKSNKKYEEVMIWLQSERKKQRNRRKKEKQFKTDLNTIIEKFINVM